MPVTWTKPELVCEIKYSEITQDGIFRHPVFITLREDKTRKKSALHPSTKNLKK
jgi:bifunctional non-homologous end joining protein LigD